MSGGIHILWSRGHYIGQVRRFGYRRWETVTHKCKTKEAAIAKAAMRRVGKDWHRLRVLFIDDNPYYEPNIVFEGKQ